MNKNVKKIFEMLGVEPNEKFKIEGRNDIYSISENLNLWHDKSKTVTGSVVDFIIGTDKIIKLPKEPIFEELMNWKRKDDEEVWFVDTNGKIWKSKREKYCKIFPNEEMIERYKEIEDKYRELGHQFTIEEWQNIDIVKYVLLIDHEAKKFYTEPWTYYQAGRYSFKEEEKAVEFIKLLGETDQEQYENACLYLY